MIVAALVGIVLEVVGLAVAITGVADTYEEATDRSLGNDLLADGRRVARRILRRPPHNVVVESRVFVGVVPASGSAYHRVLPQEPADDASIEERVDYLMRFVTRLSNDLDSGRDHASRQLADARRDIDQKLGEVEAKIVDAGRATQDLRQAVLGINGAGLRKAVFGLMVTVLGVALSMFGLFA